jgi:hypothetical protein
VAARAFFADPPQILLESTGAAEMKQLTRDAMRHIDARWLPNSNAFVFVAGDADLNR